MKVSGVCAAQSLVFCVAFCRSLSLLLSFFFWPLHCWSFLVLKLLIISLVSSQLCYVYWVEYLSYHYNACNNHKAFEYDVRTYTTKLSNQNKVFIWCGVVIGIFVVVAQTRSQRFYHRKVWSNGNASSKITDKWLQNSTSKTNILNKVVDI